MRKKQLVTATCLIFLLMSCDEEDKYLGRLPVKNNADVYFDLYQEQKFDHVEGIYYAIVDKNGRPLLRRKVLVGTSDFDREDTKDFTASSYNGIIYLTFLDSCLVYAIYDLKTKRHIDLVGDLTTRDTLLGSELKKYNARLKLSWSWVDTLSVAH